jgi:hypothetical protein
MCLKKNTRAATHWLRAVRPSPSPIDGDIDCSMAAGRAGHFRYRRREYLRAKSRETPAWQTAAKD